MNEEEKKAIEYSKNCLMKITLGIDCEFDVNILDTLLNTIKKLQKEHVLYEKTLVDKWGEEHTVKECITYHDLGFTTKQIRDRKINVDYHI